MNLRQGTLLKHGEYRIECELGHGGFGVTYLAVQVGLNRRVAIKEFFMSEYCNRDAETSHVSVPSEGSKELVAKFRNKFIKEAQNIASLKHPHIISIHDVFEDNGTAYYVMEYLDHGSLADVVKRQGRLAEADALRYIRQIADALRYIHARKMNHLDVKPGNILIDEEDHAVLIDFGLSKRYDDEGNQTSTTPVGISHGYAPLEQYKKGGVGTFSPSTDIYSLGATLYKLITGATPPDANDVNDDGLPPFPTYVSDSTAKAIEQAMHPRRKDRPQSIEEFLALLDVLNRQDEPIVIDADEATVLNIEYPKEEPHLNQWGSYKIKRPGLSGTEEVPVVDSLPMPCSIYIRLQRDEFFYDFWLNEGICNTLCVLLNDKVVHEEDWMGGIPQDVLDYLIRHGFFSREHWERESSTIEPEATGVEVRCMLQFVDREPFIRSVYPARHGKHDLLLTAIEELLDATSLKEQKAWADEAVERIRHTERVCMGRVDSVMLSFNEGSFPNARSFCTEITATSIKVEFAIMGNIVKQCSFSFSKRKFLELKSKLDTLDLHSIDTSEPAFDGGSSIHLRLKGHELDFSAGCWGGGERYFGSLNGNVPALLEVIKQNIPNFEQLWEAVKSTVNPKPAPRPQPSPKLKSQKDKTESLEVKNQWWPLINMLLSSGIAISLLLWVGKAHIPLPNWMAGVLLVGIISGLTLLNKRRKLWGYVALYVPLLLTFLWAYSNQRAEEAEEIRLSLLPTGQISGYDYVDLGLSVKWATCNIGASSPSDHGNYYAWGETTAKSDYADGTHEYYKDGKSPDFGNNISGTRYDAARMNWGGTWRMPTMEEISELNNKCTWKRKKLNGCKGYILTGPNGKSIFLPAAGFRGDMLIHEVDHGLYWSSRTNNGDYGAYHLGFDNSYNHEVSFTGYARSCGFSVRPVADK